MPSRRQVQGLFRYSATLSTYSRTAKLEEVRSPQFTPHSSEMSGLMGWDGMGCGVVWCGVLRLGTSCVDLK